MIGVIDCQGGAVAREFVGDPAASAHEKCRVMKEVGSSEPRSSPAAGRNVFTLSEHVFHLAEQRTQHGLVVDLREGVEFLQQLFLALVEFGRHLDADLDI